MSTEDEVAFTEHKYQGTTYYFCSDHCLAKFKENPGAYGAGKTKDCCNDGHGAHTKHGASTAAVEDPSVTRIYTCPMHPEVKQQGPGACPKCGMALEPLTPLPAADKTEYSCPMHPEIVQDEPGICPKCGMALEPTTPVVPSTRTEYTCPMHPEIVQDAPGN